MSDEATMHRVDLITQAIELDESRFTDLPMYPDTFTLDDETIIVACETFWGHGFADEQYGSITESPFFHAYRVHRWIVTTDSPARTFLLEEGTEDEARKRFASIVAEIEAETPTEAQEDAATIHGLTITTDPDEHGAVYARATRRVGQINAGDDVLIDADGSVHWVKIR